MTMTETPAYVAGYPLAEIVAGYVECALWAGLDWTVTTDHGGEEDNPRPLDDVYGPDDIDAESMALIEADVLTFARQAWHVAETAGWSADQFGHDYFLTRNGHGTGFWDRGRSVGDHLSSMARSMGEMDLYVGGGGDDDGAGIFPDRFQRPGDPHDCGCHHVPYMIEREEVRDVADSVHRDTPPTTMTTNNHPEEGQP